MMSFILFFKFFSYKASGAKVTLSGKPTKAGTYKFKLTAKDKNGVSTTKTFSIKVTEPAITGTFKAGVIKTTYSGSATVTGGTAPYTWTQSGKPTGLTYKASGAKVTLSGKPTKAGTYKFKLTAKDKNGVAVTKTFSITITSVSKSKTSASEENLTSFNTQKFVEAVPVVEQLDIKEVKENGTNFSVTTTELKVLSEDIFWQGEGRDEDLIEVKAGKPVNFIIGE